jgi:hypothetical protein
MRIANGHAQPVEIAGLGQDRVAARTRDEARLPFDQHEDLDAIPRLIAAL